MNKKKLLIIIIIILLFFSAISIYKYKIYDVNKMIKTNDMFNKYSINKIKENKKIEEEILDKNKYKDSIINENLLSIDYNFYMEEKTIFGKIYIDSNKNLYISDTNNKLSYKISNIKFKTMFKRDYPYKYINLFLISEDNELYILLLKTNDIKKAELTKIKTNYEIISFADIDINYDIFGSGRLIFVLSADGNIYNAINGIRYNENTISLYNKFFVHDDNTITTTHGKLLQDENNNNYKIKYVFNTFEDNTIFPENSIILITDDNQLIYVDNEDKYVFGYKKIIKNIIFNEKKPYTKSKLEIVFKDESKIKLDAACNYYYCINKITN